VSAQVLSAGVDEVSEEEVMRASAVSLDLSDENVQELLDALYARQLSGAPSVLEGIPAPRELLCQSDHPDRHERRPAVHRRIRTCTRWWYSPSSCDGGGGYGFDAGIGGERDTEPYRMNRQIVDYAMISLTIICMNTQSPEGGDPPSESSPEKAKANPAFEDLPDRLKEALSPEAQAALQETRLKNLLRYAREGLPEDTQDL